MHTRWQLNPIHLVRHFFLGNSVQQYQTGWTGGRVGLDVFQCTLGRCKHDWLNDSLISCKRGRELSDNGLTALPENVFGTTTLLEVLILTRNNITKLPPRCVVLGQASCYIMACHVALDIHVCACVQCVPACVSAGMCARGCVLCGCVCVCVCASVHVCVCVLHAGSAFTRRILRVCVCVCVCVCASKGSSHEHHCCAP